MNAPQTLYQVSHSVHISRYGAHTSLTVVERIDVIEVLTQMLGNALSLQAQLDCLEPALRNISFLPVRQLFRRLAQATADYARFLAGRIADLGGYAEPANLYRLNEVAQRPCFAGCLSDINRHARRLQAADCDLRGYQQNAAANEDVASQQFFAACLRRNAQLLSLISSNLPHE